jgi:DNA-directed RNA polymerase subunit H (RpoH/RPB5)
MEENTMIESSTLGRIVSIVERMPEEEKYKLLRKLRLKEALEMAKQHDEQVKEVPENLTEEEIVQMVREVREELFKNGYQNNP